MSRANVIDRVEAALAKRKAAGQLNSVLDWLVEHRKTRTWLAERLGHRPMWASNLFRGEIACSVPTLLKLAKLTGLPLESLALECLR